MIPRERIGRLVRDVFGDTQIIKQVAENLSAAGAVWVPSLELDVEDAITILRIAAGEAFE